MDDELPEKIKPEQKPIHPGDILLEEFLKPMAINPADLARETNRPVSHIQSIISGRQSITPEVALLLSRFFELSDRFWLNIQSRYDSEIRNDR